MEQRNWLAVAFLGLVAATTASAGESAAEVLERLKAVYATQPQDYPAGKEYARPDLSASFRWHFYHAGAIERFADARMQPHVESYNPLEGQGVRADKDGAVQWEFVTEHATAGRQALRVVFGQQAVRSGQAVVRIQGIAGSQFFSEYLRARHMLGPACTYGPHFRWIKLDVFNPSDAPVRVRLCGVPLRLQPGFNVAAVKTADAVDRHYRCGFVDLPFEVVQSAGDVTLFLDNARMEQEVPAVLRERGRLLQFPGRAEAADAPVLWPGFSAVENDTLYTPERTFGWTRPARTRVYHGHSFRSFENGLLWGHCSRLDGPLRVDLANGRYGIWLLAAPSTGFPWSSGGTVRVNGVEQTLFQPRDPDQVRRLALGGESWDFRPGACVWEALVRPAYYPEARLLTADVTDGRLLLDFQAPISLHALAIFPEADRAEAVKELGRLNFLLAESWDVSHPWIKGNYAARANDGHPYIGAHEEMIHPERIPERLAALPLGPEDIGRGFVLFQRGLTEAVYPDTVPSPAETAVRELRCFAAPGEFECVTLGLFPLAERAGLRIRVSDLATRDGKQRLEPARIDVRVSRYHQKTMQFGHHNHDYNYQEHYLIARPTLDLVPGAARRVYFDIGVPADAAPGEYAGQVRIESADGQLLSAVPLVLEVLPLPLRQPPVWFAGSLAHPRLKEYGFNAFHTSYDDAVKHGYGAYLANLGHGPVPFCGQSITWNNFLANNGLLAPLVEAGAAGKGPRGYFGGPAPGTHANPRAAQISDDFFRTVRKEFPRIDLLGRTLPVYCFRQGKSSFQVPHEWIVLAGAAQKDEPAAIAAQHKSGGEFWYIDGLRHSKELAARFTFGVWLWRLGASGRFTTLQAHLQYGGGTARLSYPYEPYYTLLDVTTCNVDRALKESLDGRLNPCRDLILLREGIDDYRYLHTLEHWLERTSKEQPAHPAVSAARAFRERLWAEIVPDLARYFHARGGAYGENWYPTADNTWNSERLNQLRRACADHILALSCLGGK